jgi:DNA-binding MarR family transcriptional regulator
MEEPARIEWLMGEAVHLAHRALNEAVRPHGVTTSQSAVLQLLERHPGLSGSELVRELARATAGLPLQPSPNTAHRAMASLEGMGLVERTPDARNARIVRSALTEDGRRVAADCRAAWRDLQREVLAPFGPGEQEQLTDLLGRYIRALATHA